MFQELHTQRLSLLKITNRHSKLILKGLSNPLVTQFMLIHYETEEAVQEQMIYYKKQYKTQNGIYWLIQTTQENNFIGTIGINNWNKTHLKAELGFWILPEHFNKGYITEAAKTVMNFCFNNLGLNRMEATVETENIASMKVLKKLGFLHEGTFREFEMNKGKYIDLMMFSILKKEYKND